MYHFTKVIILFSIFFSCSKKVVRKNQAVNKVKTEKRKKFPHISTNLIHHQQYILIEGQSDTCFISWIYKQGSIIAKNRQCLESIDVSSLIEERMLAKAFGHKSINKSLKYFRGNIEDFPEAFENIILESYNSDSWDYFQGLPSNNESIQSYLKNLIDKKPVFLRYQTIFNSRCLEMSLLNVQGGKTQKASRLHFYPKLKKKNIKRNALIPTNFKLVFNLMKSKC